MSLFTDWFKNRKLQVDILTLFSGIFLFSFACIISYTYVNYSKSIQKFAENYVKEIGQTINHKIGDLFEDIILILNTAPALVFSASEVNLDNIELNNWTFENFSLFPNLDGYYFSTYDGSLLEYYKIPPKAVYRNDRSRFLNSDINYALRFIDRSQKEVTEVWVYKNKFGETVETENVENVTFDPRVRPWFVQVKEKDKIFWTDVYQFDETQEPGITASTLLIDRFTGEPFGVMGADMTLRLISESLAKNKIGKTGESVLRDDNGKVLVTQAGFEEDPQLFSSAYEIQRKSEKTNFVFDWHDAKYMALFLDFSPFLGKRWSIETIVSLHDLLRDVKKNYQNMVVFSLVIVGISSVIVAFFSRRISKPIVILADEANQITNLHLEKEIHLPSKITEIDFLATALEAVRKGMGSFGRYVPKEIVRKLLKQNEEITLSGSRKELTIFFSNIEDFISLIENRPAEDLLLQLEEYFGPLSTSILENHGTIDKYMAGGIMAFWGAPTEVTNHALFACRTALLCQAHSNDLNEKWKKENKPAFFTNIGIHTGDVIVGTVGTIERMNYTVIGDSVNLTSRIEHACKIYKTKTLISQKVYQRISDEQFLTRPVDIVTVVGKQEKVKIYELLGQMDDPRLAPEKELILFCQKFKTAFEVYFEQKWQIALELFTELNRAFPSDFLTQMYIKRCEEYLKNPPGLNWDGVTHLSTKG